jgi:glutathione S-transferase
MTLVLHARPLSSYCHKVLIALDELAVPFELSFLNLGSDEQRRAFYALWPIGKMPVLEDRASGLVLPEASIIIEWLNTRAGGTLIPSDPAQALEVRLWDRIFDLHVHTPMQAFAADLLRPEGQRDPLAVFNATLQLATAYDLLESRMTGREWAAGDAFSLADCAAAPALFYAGQRVPFGHRTALAAYCERLKARPSYARVLREAEPYFHLVPR